MRPVVFLLLPVLVLALISPSPAAETVYRCRDAQGQTTFSDTPCGADAERIEVRPMPSVTMPSVAAPRPAATPEPAVAGQPARPKNNCPSASAINQAIFHKQIVLCMSPAQVDRAADPSMRENFRSSSGADADGSYTERYYARGDEGWPRYIKFRNGKVAEFREDAPPPACYPNCNAGYGTPIYPYPVYPQPLPYPTYPVQPPRPTPRTVHGVDARITLGDDRQNDRRLPEPEEQPPAPPEEPRAFRSQEKP